MPNWCENDLTVRGDEKELQRFLEFVKTHTSDFDFNTILPYPESFSNMDTASSEWRKNNPPEKWFEGPRDGFNSGGYEWCVAQWGTKWNACDVKVEFQCKDEVLISFSTAWSPPLPVIKALSSTFKELQFELKYYEHGMGYQGEYSVEGGEVCADVESNYTGERGG